MPNHSPRFPKVYGEGDYAESDAKVEGRRCADYLDEGGELNLLSKDGYLRGWRDAILWLVNTEGFEMGTETTDPTGFDAVDPSTKGCLWQKVAELALKVEALESERVDAKPTSQVRPKYTLSLSADDLEHLINFLDHSIRIDAEPAHSEECEQAVRRTIERLQGMMLR